MKNTNNYIEMRNKGVNTWKEGGLVGNVLKGKSLNSIRIPKKKGHLYTEGQLLDLEIKEMIAQAKDHKDLNALGKKIRYVKDSGIKDINTIELDYLGSKKMREIYNKIGEYAGE